LKRVVECGGLKARRLSMELVSRYLRMVQTIQDTQQAERKRQADYIKVQALIVNGWIAKTLTWSKYGRFKNYEIGLWKVS